MNERKMDGMKGGAGQEKGDGARVGEDQGRNEGAAAGLGETSKETTRPPNRPQSSVKDICRRLIPAIEAGLRQWRATNDEKALQATNDLADLHASLETNEPPLMDAVRAMSERVWDEILRDVNPAQMPENGVRPVPKTEHLWRAFIEDGAGCLFIVAPDEHTARRSVSTARLLHIEPAKSYVSPGNVVPWTLTYPEEPSEVTVLAANHETAGALLRRPGYVEARVDIQRLARFRPPKGFWARVIECDRCGWRGFSTCQKWVGRPEFRKACCPRCGWEFFKQLQGARSRSPQDVAMVALLESEDPSAEAHLAPHQDRADRLLEDTTPDRDDRLACVEETECAEEPRTDFPRLLQERVFILTVAPNEVIPVLAVDFQEAVDVIRGGPGFLERRVTKVTELDPSEAGRFIARDYKGALPWTLHYGLKTVWWQGNDICVDDKVTVFDAVGPRNAAQLIGRPDYQAAHVRPDHFEQWGPGRFSGWMTRCRHCNWNGPSLCLICRREESSLESCPQCGSSDVFHEALYSGKITKPHKPEGHSRPQPPSTEGRNDASVVSEAIKNLRDRIDDAYQFGREQHVYDLTFGDGDHVVVLAPDAATAIKLVNRGEPDQVLRIDELLVKGKRAIGARLWYRLRFPDEPRSVTVLARSLPEACRALKRENWEEPYLTYPPEYFIDRLKPLAAREEPAPG